LTIPLPDSVNILGVQYTIEYCDNPAEVDLHKRKSLWGQIDYWTRTIRVYNNDRPRPDVWQTILHEVIHAIVDALHMDVLADKEDDVDLLALALMDVLERNEWMRLS